MNNRDVAQEGDVSTGAKNLKVEPGGVLWRVDPEVSGSTPDVANITLKRVRPDEVNDRALCLVWYKRGWQPNYPLDGTHRVLWRSASVGQWYTVDGHYLAEPSYCHDRDIEWAFPVYLLGEEDARQG